MSLLVLSLGSNLGETSSTNGRKSNLDRAIELLLENGMKIENKSSIYETEPVGFKPQPKFLNIVLSAQTKHSPQACLKIIHQIESELNRIREIKDGPRTIDLDIIFYDNSIIFEKDLVIPHPRMHQRAFVLKPLAEILPDYFHPVYNKTVNQLLQEIDTKGVKIWS
jgi:2-amino-4-hydroxy-6-hydroxymethyldihydropteridine diphosphokinase